jgi:hypothetical protein
MDDKVHGAAAHLLQLDATVKKLLLMVAAATLTQPSIMAQAAMAGKRSTARLLVG